MPQTTIAVIADCDGTLAPDTTNQLLDHFNVDLDWFWQGQVQPLVKAGWDEHLAYLQKMLDLSREGQPLEGLTSEKLAEIGGQLNFYPGVPDGFISLREEVQGISRFRDVGIRVEFYVISAGIGDMLRASVLSRVAHRIWACDFAYDETGKIRYMKNVISFTDKTRFLFLVNKGRVGMEYSNQPYVVNVPMNEEERPVPFKNMVYVGDGPTDIPCMSLLADRGGYVIGILGNDASKAWALGYGRRTHVTVPPEFSPGEHGYEQIKQAVISIADNIRLQMRPQGPVPSH